MPYKFTTNWFNKSVPKKQNLKILSKELATTKKLAVLECGTFEGRSAIWFKDHVCKHRNSSITTIDLQLPSNLKYNLSLLAEEDKRQKLTFLQGDFLKVLPKLLAENKKYDLIYIDGGKYSFLTIAQIVFCWEMLEPGGILYLDDSEWGEDRRKYKRPKEAINFFLKAFEEQYELLFRNIQVGVRKKKISFERSSTMLSRELLTLQEFKAKQKTHPEYWKNSRWQYTSRVIEMLKNIPRDLDSILEIGSADLPLVKNSTVMDISFSPEIKHDITITPWPLKNKEFDMVVALQVWEHLGNDQEGAFKELMRVSNEAILSFPYQWDRCHKNDCHYMVTKDMIKKWTCGVKPVQVVEVTASNGLKRLIYRWVFNYSQR